MEEARVISHGIVPVYTESVIESCSIIRFGKPALLDLSSLVCSPKLAGFFAESSRRDKFGPPLLELSPRKKVLNESYWASLICEAMSMRFDVDREIFVQHPEKATEKVILVAELYALVLAVLRSRQAYAQIPSGELQPKRVKAIIETMKLLFLVDRPSEQEAFVQFVQERLERRAGGVLFKADAAKACRRFFESRNWLSYARMPENNLRHKVTETIFKQFRIGESHDRGRVFRALGLRPPPSDGPHPSPAPSGGSP